MVKVEEKKIVAWSLIALGLLFSIIAAITDCSAGGADNYAHFNIAYWSFKYPYLLLDHWGKPVYTILIAPFTQLGFYGVRLFNIIGGLLTTWICYLLALRWKLPKAWLVAVFVIFAPLYFVLMFTGMTEILFSLVLMFSILLFFKERFILSAFILSFAILVRSEGFVFFPIFLLAFTLKRKFSAIPFLLSGFLIFSLIGQLYYYHDFLWLIHNLPYGGAGEIYGSGSWYHFLLATPDYLGYVISLLFLTGLVYLIKEWLETKSWFNSDKFYQLLILGGCFFVYMAAHAYMWWIGQMSLGLVRVMVGVSPIAGLIALVGYNRIEKFIPSAQLKGVLLAITLLLTVIPGALKYKSEFAPDPHKVVMERAIGWLRQTHNLHHHLIVHDPSFAFISKIDAWDQQVIQYGFSDINVPEKDLPDSSIFIWDAHFSQNEGKIPASKILENPSFELVAYFEPVVPFTVLNGFNYCVMVFRKVKSRSVDNFQVLDNMKENLVAGDLIYSERFDFETSVPEKVTDKFRIASNDSIPNFYYQMGAESDFSPCILITNKQLNISSQLKFVVNFDFLAEEAFAKDEVAMVFSVEENDKSYSYQGADILPFALNAGQWNHAKFHFSMPEEVKPNSIIKIYIWDIKKRKLKLDNFSVQVYSKKIS
ncbi:MAG TPA: hypothetical protein VGK10_00430 [Prolixibacteraceae bacterium]|jgi:hypothetical protein